jgi:hypothetical protein
MKRTGHTADKIGRYAEFVKDGRRVVLVTTKRDASRIHAALKRIGVGTREGDTWKIGKGSIEVRT